jgi:hypothetical protein
MTAMQELVVPKSIPMTFGIKFVAVVQREDNSNPGAMLYKMT